MIRVVRLCIELDVMLGERRRAAQRERGESVNKNSGFCGLRGGGRARMQARRGGQSLCAEKTVGLYIGLR